MSDELSPDQTAQGSRRRLLTGMGAAAAGAGVLVMAGAPNAAAAVDNGTYFSIPPERILDTRNIGGRIRAGETRSDEILSEGEGLAAVCNITVVNTTGTGYLAVFNADESRPVPYSTVNWWGARQVVANLAIVELGAAGINVYCGGGTGTGTDFLIDLVGLFETPVAADRSARVRRFEDSMERRLRRRR